MQGGSTITMQPVPDALAFNTCTLGKTEQILRAVQLELSYSGTTSGSFILTMPLGWNIEMRRPSLVWLSQ